jgi:putative sterol carrier protein
MSNPGPRGERRPLTGKTIGQLSPSQLVEAVEALEPSQVDELGLDIEVLGGAIDPRELSRDQFVRLLGALDRLASAGADIDLSRMGAGTFARIVAKASGSQVEGMMGRPELRARILGEIFRRMSEHFRTEKAASTRAVVHWRITGGAGAGGFDRYETVIEGGTCVVNADPQRDPRVTITVHPADFLKLITRNASGPVLFMTGKMRIKGDLAFAAGLTSLFDLPRAS